MEVGNSKAYLEAPSNKCDEHVSLLGEFFEMNPQEAHSRYHEQDVDMQEGLIECVPESGKRVQCESDESDDSHQTSQNQFATFD